MPFIKILKDDAEEDQFLMDWYKEFDWFSNPFKPLVISPQDLMVNLEKEKQKINLFIIKQHDFGIIKGDDGLGKTTLLRWMSDELRKYKDKVSVDYIHDSSINETKVMRYLSYPLRTLPEKLAYNIYTKLNLEKSYIRYKKKAASDDLFLKIFNDLIQRYSLNLNSNNIPIFMEQKLKKRSLVILIDDIQNITSKSLDILKKISSFKSVQLIVTGTSSDIKKSRISSLGRDRLGISMPKLTFEQMSKMIALRLQFYGAKDSYPFDTRTLKRLYMRSDKNPKKMLRLCYDYATKLSIKIHQQRIEDAKISHLNRSAPEKPPLHREEKGYERVIEHESSEGEKAYKPIPEFKDEEKSADTSEFDRTLADLEEHFGKR